MSTSNRRHSSRRRRGGALLAVLWLSAALSAIAFAVATKVRAETSRASTLADGVRARFLAKGAIERAIQWVDFAPRGSGPTAQGFSIYSPRMRFLFPGGIAIVEMVAESSKLSLNEGTRDDFLRLLLALGADPARADAIAGAILQWRGAGGDPALDNYYLNLRPSFRPPHASFEDVEEAIYVRGMTPELFHGSYSRDPQGRLHRLGAFKDCVSIFGSTREFEVNGIEPALMVAIGVPPQSIPGILALRQAAPVDNGARMAAIRNLAGPAGGRLRYFGNTIYTIRATARIRNANGSLGDLRRTVAAQVKFFPEGTLPRHQILRWYEQAYSEVSQWQ